MIVRVAFRYDDRKHLFSRVVCWLRGGDSARCAMDGKHG